MLWLLDVGCGNGIMLSSLIKELPDRHAGITFEFFGIDVGDSNVQQKGYFKKTTGLLKTTNSQINREDHLKLLKFNETWPFPDDHFDLIFSNLVIEHVFNLSFFGEKFAGPCNTPAIP